MKRPILLLTFLLCVCAASPAQTLKDYLKLRKQNGITQSVGEEALETFVGTRVMEVRGVAKGTMRVSNGPLTILLEKTNGETLFINCPNGAPDWLNSNETPARMIIKAERSSPNAEIQADLLAAAPESQIAPLEHTSQARSKHLSYRGGFAHTTGYDVSANSAVPIYAHFIMNRNRRLSEEEAQRIAVGVIGYSLKFGVDARLIMAMVMVESGFNPNARSRTGAMGLGQLMPGTAAGMGVSDAYDSIDNLYGTVRLIRGHLENYQRQTGQEYDSLVLALAAYNAGPGAVSRHGGVPPYRETQNYVRKVIGIYEALCGVGKG
jgi:soluble lytic murein transglycosylase-like protein